MGRVKRREIETIPATTNETLLRVFGTVMPMGLLLARSPGYFFTSQWESRQTPPQDIDAFIQAETDDVARVGETLVFVHRWQGKDFDPTAFARAKVFLAKVTRGVRQAGYRAEPFDPLSPQLSLPRLAVEAGLGNLSPYGLLVHPRFGPRLILTGLKTDYPWQVSSQQPEAGGCTDCMVCVRKCPQNPIETGTVNMAVCKSCTRCLTVCPVGS